MIKIFHAREPKFFAARGAIKLSDYAHVANVYGAEPGADPLERAYMLTNSIDSGWYENDKDVAFLGSPDHGMKGCRSTSVGDLMQVGGQFHEVVGVGFQPVEVQP